MKFCGRCQFKAENYILRIKTGKERLFYPGDCENKAFFIKGNPVSCLQFVLISIFYFEYKDKSERLLEILFQKQKDTQEV